MQFVIGPPTELDRKVEDGAVIAIATTHDGRVRNPIVGVEQGDWVDEVHISRKNGDSRYGYILYLPLS